MKTAPLSRRDFLHMTALSIGAMGVGAPTKAEASSGESICLVAEQADRLASSAPVVWAMQELERVVAERGVTVRHAGSLKEALESDLYVAVSEANAPFAAATLKQANVSVPVAPEGLALVPSRYKGKPLVLACGGDPRGLMYAVLELADRAQHSEQWMAALVLQQSAVERPFNAVRSIGRLFVSDIEDKPWFYDRKMWPAYFAMLATQRFNRFSLGFGNSHDTLQYVIDSYFLFAYPFLLSVPGYKVRAVNLPDEERDRNLEMLQYISRQAVAHGIDFQLGIWTHGHQWMDSPHANYTIEGLTPENHAAYSRDALAALLQMCPDISGVTLRTHGESGVREGSYSFWKTVFQGAAQSGRKVEIDLHTKGLDQTLIDGALATGMPLKLSPKYWAEHTGMPYQQTAIRELEMPREAPAQNSYYSLSTGPRLFTRYGYADFLRTDRPYSVMFRIWPGSHRFLLWGDPVTNAAHSRAFRFCGADGVELFEPLSFKGRRGSGNSGGRCAYADASLNPHWDWEKYLYTYRIWGRLLYNSEAKPETWRRHLRKEFRNAAPAVESSMASATRIVPIVVTAHLPSGANDTFGPEFYTNQPIVDPNRRHPYGDTPSPKVFENVSPLDPQLFSRTSDFVDELLKGKRSAKYSPIDVAQWLEDLADEAIQQLMAADANIPSKTSAGFRRVMSDVKIQAGLGRFFAAKLRSGTLYAIHERTGDRAALEEALKAYRLAGTTWSKLAEEAKSVYVSDISYGPLPHQRGHWSDRLPDIEADIADMASKIESLNHGPAQPENVRLAIQEAMGRPKRNSSACLHTPPEHFTAGKPLEIALAVNGATPSSVRLLYRHVNQAEHYEMVKMQSREKQYRATIPAAYTASDYPLQYYFEVDQGPDKPQLFPGFMPNLANQPYFVVTAKSR